MWYLKGSLLGEAQQLIKHLTTSDANYTTAWTMLNERYENKKLLVNALLNKLINQVSITTENSAAIKALHDTTQECLLALQNLELNIKGWDPIMLHILIKRIDRTTHTLWEQSLSRHKELPSLDEFLRFLEFRFQSLEAINSSHKTETKQINTRKSLTVAVKNYCALCHTDHPLFMCPRFLQMPTSQRISIVKKYNICYNCLKHGHNVGSCPSRGCVKCGKKHNTLLHLPPLQASNQCQPNSLPLKVTESKHASLATNAKIGSNDNYILLGTALVEIMAKNGTAIRCRAILDSGSQLNFITEEIIKKLGLEINRTEIRIEGIGKQKQTTQRRVNIVLKSCINGFQTTLETFILPNIISPQPATTINTTDWRIPANIPLADPTFNQPDQIDLLIGAEIFYSILSIGQIRVNGSWPILQNTVFGWIAAGKIPDSSNHSRTTCGINISDLSLEKQIEKTWILEDLNPLERQFTAIENKYENHFDQTTKRDTDGRFIVKLMFLKEPQELGESKNIALQRFISLEHKLVKNQELYAQYKEFMNEFLQLNHMKEVQISEIEKPYYFLPHHCVFKPDSSTTKIRVVFDASAKTTTNISLNQILATGPTIQDDIFSILIRFRMHRFVFTADIEKMYRQVLLNKDQQKYQLIWWRDNPNSGLKTYQFQTITYGTTSAPYLATKCLQALAKQHQKDLKEGAIVLERDFYVDDVLTGADTLSTALEKQSQLQSILYSAGFKLRKWCANHPQLLQKIQPQDQEIELDFHNKTEDHIKTVGLTWLPKEDNFCIKTTWEEQFKITKRTAYSDIARLFDPLGIMGPVVVTAKIFLQRLWAERCDWDAALTQELHSYWSNFRKDLRILNNVKFPRHVFANKIPKTTQFHIFADASEKAYGAAAYVRAVDKDKIVSVRLLCAKSRVAPLKTTTIPRLELCAAKLAAELAQRIKKDLNATNLPMFLWSDSEIVLSWIHSPSSSYQTFVANRISTIQQLTSVEHWRHVKSQENPADILSRGLTPAKLGECQLWFYGPKFLHGTEEIWPAPFKSERRSATTTLAAVSHEDILQNITQSNSFRKIQRIIAYVTRFINRTRSKIPATRAKKEKITSISPLTVLELNHSFKIVVKIMQQEKLREDLKDLRRSGEVAKTSSIASLTPFLDADNIIRVGGRLQESSLSYEAKHPILLPYDHHLTKCLLHDIHLENLHVGAQTLLAIARQTVWPIKGKTLARSIVQHCVQCAKAKPRLLTQLMGNLLKDRVQPARPFVIAGIDFCGPIWTHFKIRGKKPQKSYVAVFCCFATKATHLEVVSDLTTQGFLGALRRFMSRRGHCRTIYCDNATNFVGAKNLLELRDLLTSAKARDDITKTCSTTGIEFKFIPPRSPHFGGLWEAAVKSAKQLLQRIISKASLTYEELETAITQIEAILNSRPLTPMSDDPNDLAALTPGHFLIGEAMTSSIDFVASPIKTSLIGRWKYVNHIKNEFWTRWSSEYLHQLQHRYKWKQRCQNIQINDMVLIHEDNIPSLKWPMGRIINIVRGRDGLVRVADIRTTSGTIRRPVHKLAPLPIESSEKEEREGPSTSRQSENDTNSSTNESTIPAKRIKLTSASMLMTMMLACLIFPFSETASVKISPFVDQPGIYFENLGLANIVANEWHLIAFYEMGPYWAEYNFLHNCTQEIIKICQQLQQKNLCTSVGQHLTQYQNQLSSNHVLLSGGMQRARKTRGAINIVGNVANSLFGILDSDYAREMSQTINEIYNDEDHLFELFKNQTSFLDATLNIMKKEEESINHQFVELDSLIQQVNQHINTLSTDLQQEKLAQVLNSLSILASMSASSLFQIQADLLNVLTETNQGRISPHLITPTQLMEEIANIKQELPHFLRLPIPTEDILNYFQIMNIEGRILSQRILFKLIIPLTSLEDFELFKITSIPVLINGSFYAIQPSTQFLIVNLFRDQYYPINTLELRDCQIVAKDKHICNQKHAILRRTSNIARCEMDFINHMPHPASCQVINMTEEPHWIQLYSPNKWIYAMKTPTTIDVVCESNITHKTLMNTRILEILNRCLIKQSMMIIQGHNTYPSNSRLSFNPSSNLTFPIIMNSTQPISYTNFAMHPNATYNLSHAAELKGLTEQLDHLRMQSIHEHTVHDIHQYAVGYGALTLTIVMAIILSWRSRECLYPKIVKKSSTDTIQQQHIGTENESSRFNTEFIF